MKLIYDSLIPVSLSQGSEIGYPFLSRDTLITGQAPKCQVVMSRTKCKIVRYDVNI